MTVRRKVFVPVYRWTKRDGTVVTTISGRTCQTEAAAWRVPHGPLAPNPLQIIDVIEVEWTERK